MIGKLTRILVGRSVARKRGYNAAAGAAAGFFAPYVLKGGAHLIGKAGSAVKNARRRRRGPEYLKQPLSKV